jgi:hypothetical protein
MEKTYVRQALSMVMPDFGGKPAVIYIGEGAQIGYLPGNPSRALGWR